jgi:hypothetical protein
MIYEGSHDRGRAWLHTHTTAMTPEQHRDQEYPLRSGCGIFIVILIAMIVTLILL